MNLRIPFVILLVVCTATTAPGLELRPLGVHETGVFDESAAEIVQYHPDTKRLYVTNGNLGGVDVISLADPSAPRRLFGIEAGPGESVQSVAVSKDLVALAVAAPEKTDPGKVVFFRPDGRFLAEVEVGPQPDMVTFTPDGKVLLSANEGEPSEDYAVDPRGSVSIIDIPGPSESFGRALNLGFEGIYPSALTGIHPGNPSSSLAQNLEPEYIAVAPDGSIAMVTLQEANAVAIIDLSDRTIRRVVGLGFKDHREHPFDASDRDDGIRIRPWPVFGLYQPDSIIAFSVGGETFFATANEGDSREYGRWNEETRVGDLALDPTAFPKARDLQRDRNLGRLKTTAILGDDDGDGDHDRIFAFGGRSFSILDRDGNTVFESGDWIEKRLAELLPDSFNSDNDENDSFDERSDDKGPEPEALAFARIDGRAVLFVGLERTSSLLAFDVSDPASPAWLGFANPRDFSGDAEKGTAGDLGPESMVVIPAAESPSQTPLLVVANEVSGTTRIHEIVMDPSGGNPPPDSAK